MHVKFHFIMLFTFNSYILSKTIVSRIHVPYNQNLIEILQTFPQQRAGHHLVLGTTQTFASRWACPW